MPLHECFHVPVTSCQRAEVKRVLHCDATTSADMNVLLLLASAITGKTVRNSIECIEYYGGIHQGISAIFSAVDSINGHRIDALFRADDIPNYAAFAQSDNPL